MRKDWRIGRGLLKRCDEVGTSSPAEIKRKLNIFDILVKRCGGGRCVGDPEAKEAENERKLNGCW